SHPLPACKPSIQTCAAFPRNPSAKERIPFFLCLIRVFRKGLKCGHRDRLGSPLLPRLILREFRKNTTESQTGRQLGIHSRRMGRLGLGHSSLSPSNSNLLTPEGYAQLACLVKEEEHSRFYFDFS